MERFSTYNTVTFNGPAALGVGGVMLLYPVFGSFAFSTCLNNSDLQRATKNDYCPCGTADI